MGRRHPIPELTFHDVDFGENETPWDLKYLLFKGGAAANVRKVETQIATGELGPLLKERISLIVGIHEYLADRYGSGLTRSAVATMISRIRAFFTWLDLEGKPVSVESVPEVYVAWTEWLRQRVVVRKIMAANYAYTQAATVAKILDSVIGASKLLLRNRVPYPRDTNRRIKFSGNKESVEVEQSFQFGAALLDMIDSLTVEAIRGRLPLRLKFRSGETLEEWLQFDPEANCITLQAGSRPSTRKVAQERREAFQNDPSLDKRSPWINMRLQCELLVFLAQTGMGLSEAYKLSVDDFRYLSHLDGYQVYRTYKKQTSRRS